MLRVIVRGMIYLMALFSCLHLFGAHPDWRKVAAPCGVMMRGLLLLDAAAGLAYAARPLNQPVVSARTPAAKEAVK